MAKSFTRPASQAAAAAPAIPRGGPSPAFAESASPRLSPPLQSAPPAPPLPATPAHEDIARAAYYHWQRHGGTCEENWCAAERELRQRPQH